MILAAFAVYMGNALGRRRSLMSVGSSATLALTSFLYIYTFASYFKVVISVLHNFYNYIIPFDAYILNKNTDHIIIAFGISLWFALSIKKGKARFVVSAIYGGLTITAVLAKLDIILNVLALLSVPLLILLLACNRFVPKIKILNKDVDTELSTNYIVVAGLVISIAGLLASLIPFFYPVSPGYSPMRNYEYELFVLFSSSFAPLLLSLLILSVPVKILLFLFTKFTTLVKYKIRKKYNKKETPYVSKNSNTNHNNKNNGPISRTKIIFFLSLCMLLSASMALIPHQPAVNKDNRPVGVDIHQYVTAVKDLSSYSNNPQMLVLRAFAKIPPFQEERPVSLLVFFTVAKILSVSDPTYVIDYMPVILGPALVLVIFFLTREMTSNDAISILAAFLTTMSFHVLVGIYAGLYANWFALIIGYLSFVFLFKFLKIPRALNFIIYSTLVILLLLSHVYTWSMVAIVTGIFLIVMLKFNYYRRKSIILLLLVILSPVAIDIIRTSITGSKGGISFGIEFAQSELGLNHLPSFRANLLDTTQHWLGGLFGNFIILALAFYWLLKANHREPYNIFIMIYLSIGIVPLFFSGWLLQSRTLYNVPFQIPAAVALNYIIARQQIKGIMILVPICIWLVGISIVALSNFYLVPPRGGS